MQRPFHTFNLRPFLWAEKSDLGEIQKAYIELSRKYHPDRASPGNKEELEEFEAKSAAINQDYALLRNFWDLIATVVKNESNHDPLTGDKSRTGTPPELAAEYFELQEQLSEEPLDNSGDPAQEKMSLAVRDFHSQVAEKLGAVRDRVKELAKKYPYKGFQNSTDEAAWNKKDIENLAIELQNYRYYERFHADLKNKFREYLN